ncbi:hypothetical protein BCF46_2015 [Litoreibacter meonggei]|uniref:Uncharacterized protein n=1 Tax=Litoreibacter meonggei TaxID=1049199 RepID=A0A497WS00_9RHOB|nr:hypothetical protein [Litoreibacter meonggei]RLJ51793.1 hypothetical protein BCF46_2015 [Litoreibacter meonggei]
MKTIIATVIALTATAPAFADVSNPQAFFAMGNDSAAELTVSETSTGNVAKALKVGISANESAAEMNAMIGGADVSRDVQAFFALGNDSAAERTARN